jgi:AsmA protein
VGADAFNNPDMKGVNIVTNIKNNLIHIEEFKFKVSVLRPSISGTASLNGLLDILVKVGLPPAGWISVPVAVTGTSDKPKIKFFSRTGQGILTALYNRKINKVLREEKRAEVKTGAEQRKEKKAQEKQAKNAEKQVANDIKK